MINRVKTYNDIEKIKKDVANFSLYEQFNPNNNDINGVSLITPTQIISRFNETVNGMIGKGSHEDNLKEILKAVYGATFLNNNTHQDIQINYVNKPKAEYPCIMMVIDMPNILTNSQFNTLIELNNTIKDVVIRNNINIDIHISVDKKTYYSKHGSAHQNLDQFLEESHDLITLADNDYQPQFLEMNQLVNCDKNKDKTL